MEYRETTLQYFFSVTDKRWRQNVVLKNKNGGTRGTAGCVTDVLTTLWRLLRSITVHAHSGNLETFFLSDNKAKCC